MERELIVMKLSLRRTGTTVIRIAGTGSAEADPGEDHAFTYVNIFVAEVESGKVTRLTRGFDGSAPNADCFNPALSSNGRYVTFCSRASSSHD
jgi:Tol biopolymer transport system component